MRAGSAMALAVSVLVLGWASAQAPPKDLEWTHAFDVAVRKFGEADFAPTTQRFGIEAVRDLNTGQGMYLSEKGSLALAPGFADLKPNAAAKAPKWITGLDMPARKAGQRDFGKMTRTHSLELFHDPNSDDFVFITEQGFLAAVGAEGKVANGNRAPAWLYGFDVNARKGGSRDWKDAAKFGIEVYRDGNTGCLIYLCETGNVAVVPEQGETKPSDQDPAWLHGLDLAIRKAGEPVFGKGTRQYGIEVFRDEATGNLLFISETGTLSVVSGGAKLPAPTPNAKEPVWSHGWNVKARRFGEREFTERTQVFGGEVFRDPNANVVIYVSETGSIGAVQAK
jgi:hypothetical protein